MNKANANGKEGVRVVSKKKTICMILASVALLALLISLSYAWFYNREDMATLLKVTEPLPISILGPNGQEINSLDLDYSASDKQGDTVTVRRIICVQSPSEQFKIEIAHTTNMKNLTFKLYETTDQQTGENVFSVTDGGQTCYSNENQVVQGTYLNSREMPSNGYRVPNSGDANSAYHNENYDSYENVQTHAEPVYWIVDSPLTASKTSPVTINETQYYRTYYICEVSWTETTKETDIFYILAENVTGSSENAQ